MGAVTQEIARDTHCPLAEALRLMLPAQMRGGRVKIKTETAALYCGLFFVGIDYKAFAASCDRFLLEECSIFQRTLFFRPAQT